MSLVVYLRKEDIPSNIEYIECNDAFFNLNTMIPDSDLAKDILSAIDKATYYSPKAFTGRSPDMGNLYREYLSTGTKTLFNILTYPDKCFNIIECGQNALDFLQKINNGCVFWNEACWVPECIDDSESCDILCDDKHYANVFDFLGYVKESYGY